MSLTSGTHGWSTAESGFQLGPRGLLSLCSYPLILKRGVDGGLPCAAGRGLRDGVLAGTLGHGQMAPPSLPCMKQ